MASRIMHLAIGALLSDKIDTDIEQFLIGNLLPDAHGSSREAKARSHFKHSETEKSSGEYLDYDRFITKYKSSSSESLYLGYYSHLVSDDIWLRDVFYKYIPHSKDSVRSEKLKLYYNDFSRLNRLLISDYGLSEFETNIGTHEIEEINSALIQDIMTQLNADMQGREIDDTELELIEYDVIQNYIHTCVNDISTKIEKIKASL